MKLGLKEIVKLLKPEDRLSEIIPKTNELKLYIDKFYDYYGIRGSKASDMLEGIIKILYNSNNPERFFYAAHSLREILYPLLAKNDSKFRDDRKNNKDVEPFQIRKIVGEEFPKYDIEKIKEDMDNIYSKLSDIAHHSPWETDDHLQEFLAVMESFVNLMLDITRPDPLRLKESQTKQLESDKLVESIIDKGSPKSFLKIMGLN